MFVTEHIAKAQNPIFSFEIIPPLRGKSCREILDIVDQLVSYKPPFIDVTSHSAEAYYEELPDGQIIRHVRKKRTGTISICGIIQNRYNIDTVPHLLSRGFTKEETEDAMIELSYLGIHNVLAIRGDESNYKKTIDKSRTTNVFASDLVKQLINLKKGDYLEEIDNSDPINMCIGVGAYPEKHVESPNMKSDIEFLKKKVDAGADYIVTQMFFDNKYYFKFVRDCRKAGINVPIIPGLKILSGKRQLTSLPKDFHVNVPEELVDEIMENPKQIKEIGNNWAYKQAEELVYSGAPCIHFYIMNDASAVINVINKLRS